MSKPKPNLLLMLAIALFATAVVFNIAYGDDHDKHSGDDSGDVIVDVIGGNVDASSETIIGGSRGYAVSGSDMEINDSLSTYSIAFGLFQGTKTNPYSEADRMDVAGKYQAAAEMRCSTWKYKRVYGKGQACINAVILTVPTEITPQTPQDDARIEALYTRIAGLEAERVQDKAKAEKAAKKVNAMAQRTAQIVQQAPDDAAERRAMARAALKGEE